MIVFILKVRCGGWDGWGRDLPVETKTLGTFKSREAADLARLTRVNDPDAHQFDVGHPWIETEEVKS